MPSADFELEGKFVPSATPTAPCPIPSGLTTNS